MTIYFTLFLFPFFLFLCLVGSCQVPDILRSIPNTRVHVLRQQTQVLYDTYFASVEKIVYTTLEVRQPFFCLMFQISFVGFFLFSYVNLVFNFQFFHPSILILFLFHLTLYFVVAETNPAQYIIRINRQTEKQGYWIKFLCLVSSGRLNNFDVDSFSYFICHINCILSLISAFQLFISYHIYKKTFLYSQTRYGTFSDHTSFSIRFKNKSRF